MYGGEFVEFGVRWIIIVDSPRRVETESESRDTLITPTSQSEDLLTNFEHSTCLITKPSLHKVRKNAVNTFLYIWSKLWN